MNKGKGKEERNKIHCKGKESGCNKLNFFQRLSLMNKNKTQTQDTEKKKVLTKIQLLLTEREVCMGES